MSKTYDVWLRVAVSKLATIIEVLDGEGELLNVAATPDEVPPKAKRTITRRRLANGMRAIDLVLDLCKGGKDTEHSAIKSAFVAQGFAANSASPALSALKKSGAIVQVRPNVYKIAPRASAKAGA
jgi:hypothetical protein